MNPQELEQWEYEMGWDTEQNNVLARERGQLQDDPRIQEALDAGKFVITGTYTVFSRYNDAIVGGQTDFVSSHDTREEAEKELSHLLETENDDVTLTILPHKVIPRSIPSDDPDRDEIPF